MPPFLIKLPKELPDNFSKISAAFDPDFPSSASIALSIVPASAVFPSPNPLVRVANIAPTSSNVTPKADAIGTTFPRLAESSPMVVRPSCIVANRISETLSASEVSIL